MHTNAPISTNYTNTYVNFWAINKKLKHFFTRRLPLKRGSRATSTLRKLKSIGITLCLYITSSTLLSCIRLIKTSRLLSNINSQFCGRLARLASMTEVAGSKMKWGVLLRDSLCFNIYSSWQCVD